MEVEKCRVEGLSGDARRGGGVNEWGVLSHVGVNVEVAGARVPVRARVNHWGCAVAHEVTAARRRRRPRPLTLVEIDWGRRETERVEPF